MTALAADKKVTRIDVPWQRRTGDYGGGSPLAAGVFYQAALVGFDTSDQKLKPWITATTLKPAGVVMTASGANSASVHIESGIFPFVNGGDVTQANVGSSCYGTDDQTVTMTTTGRSIVGKVHRVTATAVWVAVTPDF